MQEERIINHTRCFVHYTYVNKDVHCEINLHMTIERNTFTHNKVNRIEITRKYIFLYFLMFTVIFIVVIKVCNHLVG